MPLSDSINVDVRERYLRLGILDGGRPGNRETDVPTISVSEPGRWQMTLTWQEADALAAALLQVVDVARNG